MYLVFHPKSSYVCSVLTHFEASIDWIAPLKPEFMYIFYETIQFGVGGVKQPGRDVKYPPPSSA
jgi:hypothetical protein